MIVCYFFIHFDYTAINFTLLHFLEGVATLLLYKQTLTKLTALQRDIKEYNLEKPNKLESP